MRRRSIVVCLVAACALIFAAVALAAGDPFVGTWKMNVAKSKFSPGPAPKGETVKLEAIAEGLKHTFDSIDAQGKSSHAEWSPKFDGKDYRITGDPTTDVGSLKRIDPNTIEVVFKKGGKEVGRWHVTVSKDGKTLTASGKGKDEKGQEFSNTELYDKQ